MKLYTAQRITMFSSFRIAFVETVFQNSDENIFRLVKDILLKTSSKHFGSFWELPGALLITSELCLQFL
jgi:hypothetical protein